jgi:hypothetical protein
VRGSQDEWEPSDGSALSAGLTSHLAPGPPRSHSAGPAPRGRARPMWTHLVAHGARPVRRRAPPGRSGPGAPPVGPRTEAASPRCAPRRPRRPRRGWPVDLEGGGGPLAPALVTFGMAGHLQGNQPVDVRRRADREGRYPEPARVQSGSRAETGHARQRIWVVRNLNDPSTRDVPVRALEGEPERFGARPEQVWQHLRHRPALGLSVLG